MEQVLDAPKLERYCMLKLQRVTAELKGVGFCPRCEEAQKETPVLPEQEDELSVARWPHLRVRLLRQVLGPLPWPGALLAPGGAGPTGGDAALGGCAEPGGEEEVEEGG